MNNSGFIVFIFLNRLSVEFILILPYIYVKFYSSLKAIFIVAASLI